MANLVFHDLTRLTVLDVRFGCSVRRTEARAYSMPTEYQRRAKQQLDPQLTLTLYLSPDMLLASLPFAEHNQLCNDLNIVIDEVKAGIMAETAQPIRSQR